MTLCPHAAAISRALFAASWPMISEKSTFPSTGDPISSKRNFSRGT